MANEIFDMFRNLLNGNNEFDDNQVIHNAPVSSRTFGFKDEEFETFSTSADKVKEIKRQEEVGGIPEHSPVEIEESLHFKKYSKRRVHKYTETEMEEIRKSCETTIVHDYSENDEYHMSDEERARLDSLNEISLKLAGLKKTYRKVDQWVEAMRVVVEAWEILEKKENFIHSEKEFFSLVAQGKIYHNRILMPRLKGMDRYNFDTLIKYISNPELDPSELMPVKMPEPEEDWYRQFDENAETEEEMLKRLVDPEMAKNIDEGIAPKMEIKPIKRKFIKGYDQRFRSSSRSATKGFSKAERLQRENLHMLLNKIQANKRNRPDDEEKYNSAYLITNSMFETPTKKKDIWDDMRFTGSWRNKYDLFIYDLYVMEEIRKQKFPGRQYQTYADVELNEFFNTMESMGMNVTNLRRKMGESAEDHQEREVIQQKKSNKKLEAALIQRLTKLNNNPKFKKQVQKTEKGINDSLQNAD